MNKNHLQNIFFGIIFSLLHITTTAQVASKSDPYVWGRFETGGGGYFTGMAFSGSTKGLMYVRSDVTPLHRMDPGSDKWVYTGETFWPEKVAGKIGTSYGFGGSNGLVVHPTDDRIVFSAMGNATGNFDGTQGIYKSFDKGNTWKQVLPVFVYSNSKLESGSQRKCGNPMDIDPQNPEVVYAGTQSNGLYRSLSKGDSGTWFQRGSIPSGSQVGTKSVVVDKYSPLVSGRSSVVYASVYNNGVFISTDGGDTFTKIAGSPKCPQWMVLGPDSALYVTNENVSSLGSTGGIWKYKGGNWTAITPASNPNGSFLGIDVNPFNAKQIAVVANGFDLFRTSNGGTSWEVIPNTSMTQSGDFNYTSQGGKIRSLLQASASVHFDPFENGTLYVCDAYMVWKSVNAFGTGTIDWVPLYKGLNNSIPFAMIAPPQAKSNTVAPLYAGGADGNNYRYDGVGGKPASFISNLSGYQQYLTGMDFSEAYPDFIWIVTNQGGSPSQTKVGWNNGGNINSGTALKVSVPYGTNVAAGGAKIAVSANNPYQAVLVGGNGKKNLVTTDGGITWKECRELPGGVMTGTSAYDLRHPLESDKVNGSKFYAFHTRNDGEFYRSDDGGFNWKLVNTDIPGLGSGATGAFPLRIAAAPFMEGNVWAALGTNGLYKSSNSGETFTKISYFSVASLVDFGANKPNSTLPTAYVHGKEATTGQWGVFRSTDMGNSWELITPDDKPFARPMVMEADRKLYGRLYISDEAVGISYGELTGLPSQGVLPAAPENMVLQVAGANIKISWEDKSPNETLFRVHRKKATDSEFKIIGLAGFNQTQYIDSTVEEQTNYSYFVEAYNEVGTNSSDTSEILAPSRVKAPSNLKADEISDMRISISWKDNSSDEDGFIVECAPVDSSFRFLGTTGANVSSFIHSNPVDRKIYSYRVKAFKGNNFSQYSNEDTSFVVDRTITLFPVNSATPNAQIVRTIPTNTLAVWNSSSTIWLGRVSTDNIACAVYQFQLPVLEAGVDITKVKFKVKTELTAAGSSQIIQLWAHPVRETSTVLTTDYYDPTYTPVGAGSWIKIGDNFCTASSLSVGQVITSNAGMDSVFTAFILDQYANSGAGKYVFIRLNQNSNQQSVRIGFDARGDADDNQPDGIPQLVLNLNVSVLSASLVPASATVDIGDTTRLKLTVLPSIASPAANWVSSDTTIAKVDQNGLVSGISEGVVTVTATTLLGAKVATSTVTSVPVVGLNVKPDVATIQVAKTKQLTTNPKIPVIWTSENAEVAMVDSTGLVTATAIGTANIRATSADGSKTGVCAIDVIKETPFNVALNKTVTVSSINSASFPGKNAVDGNIGPNDATRWVSLVGAPYPHWLEVDLGNYYNISSIKFWNGGSGAYNRAVVAFKFQAWKDSAWTDVVTETANATAIYSKSFAEVSTNRVRLYITNVVENIARIYELEVYGVPIRISNVSVTPVSANLLPGGTQQFAVAVLPVDATNNKVTWSSADTLIATVDQNGLVTAKSCGTTTIACTAQEFNKTSKAVVTVAQPVTSVGLNTNAETLDIDGTYQLTAQVMPLNACNQKVFWSSADPSVAKVDITGLVTAMGCGTTTITCTSQDSNLTSIALFTVNRSVAGIELNTHAELLMVGGAYKLTAQVMPENACNQKVFWSSDNTGVATVDSIGNVKANSTGSALIKVISQDGGYADSCQIMVKSPVNLAFNKDVMVSSQQNIIFRGKKAVDGNSSSVLSKWVSRISQGLPQWIEVDLGATCRVNGIQFWTDKHFNLTYISDFQFQIWNGSAWQDVISETGYTKAHYHKSFNEVVTNKVRLYVTGASFNFVNLYELEVYGIGSSLKSGSKQNASSEELDPDVKVFPNPANNYIIINLGNKTIEGYEINMYNSLSQKVKSLRITGENELSIQVDDLPEGFYILRIESGNYLKTHKVLIKH